MSNNSINHGLLFIWSDRSLVLGVLRFICDRKLDPRAQHLWLGWVTTAQSWVWGLFPTTGSPDSCWEKGWFSVYDIFLSLLLEYYFLKPANLLLVGDLKDCHLHLEALELPDGKRGWEWNQHPEWKCEQGWDSNRRSWCSAKSFQCCITR